MPVTLKDIAQRTGFSINTVSLVVNGKGSVAEKTRKIIEDCAKELGYVTNYSAKKLRLGSSHILALIIDDLINPYFSAIADEIITYASKYNYMVSIFVNKGDYYQEKNAISYAISLGADGILWMPTQDKSDSASLLSKSGIPYVLIDRTFDETNRNLSVIYDETRIGHLSAEHLILNGHSSVIFLNSEENLYSSKYRLRGIISAFSTYGKGFNYDNVFNLPMNVHSYRHFFSERIKEIAQKCTAIICYNDYIAAETAYYLSTLGLSVPNDISLIGFGNIQKNMSFLPKLTTIDSMEKRISMVAVDMLIDKINGKTPQAQTILPVSLVEGSSVLNLYNK